MPKLTNQIFVFDGGFPAVHFETGSATVCDAGCVKFTGYTGKPTESEAKKLIPLAKEIRKRRGFSPGVLHVEYNQGENE